MSYDVSLVEKFGKEIIDCGNYTSNVWEMFENAIPPIEPNKRGGLHLLHGMKARWAISHLQKAIKDMRERPEFYKQYNASNGWGNYEGALEFLIKIWTNCVDNKKLIYFSFSLNTTTWIKSNKPPR